MTPSPGWRPPDCWPATHGDLRAWAELLWNHLMVQGEQITLMGETIMNVQEYAQAVDAETSRLADVLAGVITQVAQDNELDQAELDAAFAPVLEHMRGVGVAGPTAPPVAEPPA